ncbi:hypothetical protein PsorP6_003774 [Peronosclerospora sorghi]|uniref:Uncharacterized protein n=1 Tax=Peronosclerospora sorghi TaxID=230839 RepID=A0ACC0VLQ0_9STRA|nr:hypothetical protein PsorP6_003774 [Peronosclerospora sorghi]
MPKVTVAGGLLILVNIGFLVAGILLLRFNSTLKKSGWAEALNGTEYEVAVDTATTMLQLLGFATMGLALAGIVGAIVQNRLMLLMYSLVMVIAMSAFGVLTGTAFTFKNKMTGWENSPFPANDQETMVAKGFNEAYCYAEGYYYCNNATAKETFEMFVPNASPEITSLLPNVTGIVSFCGQQNFTISGVDTVCKACNMSTTFAKYDKILTWAEEKCPRTATTGKWCASFLATGTAGEIYNGSPYGQCRTIFLNLAIDWTGTMAIAGLLVATAAAVIVVLTCFARRSKSESYDDVDKM